MQIWRPGLEGGKAKTPFVLQVPQLVQKTEKEGKN